MAASFITFCANWQRKPMMRRAFLSASAGMGLALAACAPQSDEKDTVPDILPFPEMAAAAELEVREGLGQTGSQIATNNGQLIEISADDLAERLANEDIRLIDVRTLAEVAEGIIPGAEHITMDRFDPAEVTSQDGREIVLYCRSGRRSSLVGEKLAAHTGKPAPPSQAEFLLGSLRARRWLFRVKNSPPTALKRGPTLYSSILHAGHPMTFHKVRRYS
ncbi:MAG: rhodanese-like domain-containing protein [Pseudomonadota bacterium]